MLISFTRRIDELGRIVIPKEVRNKLKFNTGDLLDLSVNREELIIKKCSDTLNKDYIKDLIKLVESLGNFEFLFTEGEKIVVVSENTRFKELLGKRIRDDLIKILREHRYKLYLNGLMVTDDFFVDGMILVKSIIKDSNTLGLAIMKPNSGGDASEILENVLNLIINNS